MMTSNRWTLALALLLITAGALVFRAPRLTARPFHGDEAIHAVKFGELQDTGSFQYDPKEYHGPTLHYFTLPVMWLTGRGYMDASEAYYRIVPAIFGAGLVLALWLVRREMGGWETVWAGVLTAVSSAMVFYSRYYIQEMLLVFFTFVAIASGCRYARSGKAGWAILCGLCLGMMHATKETWVIQLGAMGGAAALTMLWVRWIDGQRDAARGRFRWWVFVIAALGAILIASLFLSGFFMEAAKAPTGREKLLSAVRGPWNSVLAYKVYFGRGTGNTDHNHPWDYYLKLLAWTQYGRLWFSEGLILALAAVGGLVAVFTRPRVALQGASGGRAVLALSQQESTQMIAGALTGMFSTERISAAARAVEPTTSVAANEPLGVDHLRRRFRLFLVFYTLILTAAYAAIPYKTPWCLLGFLHGMILLGGIGAVALVRGMRRVAPMALMALVLLAGSAQLGWQAYRLNFPSYYGQRKLSLYCDQRNPYVYSHPGLTMYELIERIEGLAKVHPKGREMRINVFTKDIWPIPWYLRSFSNIGYWPDVDSAVRQGVADGINAQTMINAPVIITSTELEPAVAEQLKGSYANPDFFGLRPHVLLIVHVQSDLWEAFLKTRR